MKQTRRKTSAPITHSGWNRLALVAAERPAETVEAAVVATASPASPKVAPLRSRERRRSLRGLHNAPAHTRLLESLRRSPAFLIAAFLHLLLVVIFSFGAVAAHYEEEQLPIGLSLAPRDPAGLDAAPVRQLDSSSEPPPLADVPLTAAPQLVFAPSMAESKSPAPARLGVGAGGGGGGS
ncbi:MAG: hypothetical protein JKY65_30020, partial [Planctomycetes bacterium]|nr:hypothetical protein [Planctomycetota bacterium]